MAPRRCVATGAQRTTGCWTRAARGGGQRTICTAQWKFWHFYRVGTLGQPAIGGSVVRYARAAVVIGTTSASSSTSSSR
ncbi:hypothetical protein PVAP13_3NG080014 [Panicum virgatum]|uniref:Uncharacterized protein n=1 Tax=Panicum virgatum TaxID=38727 RepID=A0A8T0U8E9_PANVG|nr:hypothetical protein PVAP13_3NG080014 [Panicum virgatum]